jgi:hypothetical protein
MKSIAQMYMEEVSRLPRVRHGDRPEPRATLRLKAELHTRFWLPIAEMLDPYDRSTWATGAAQDLYSRLDRVLAPIEVEEGLALMKRYLGAPGLTFNTWVHLRPIFEQCLKQALTEPDRDLIVCAVRQFVRLAFGLPVEAEYGHVEASIEAVQQASVDPGLFGDEWRYDFPDESAADYAHWSNCDWKVFFQTKALEKMLDDAEEFAAEFPLANSHHRLLMARALEPIMNRAWETNWWVWADVLPHVRTLLAINYRIVGTLEADRHGTELLPAG